MRRITTVFMMFLSCLMMLCACGPKNDDPLSASSTPDNTEMSENSPSVGQIVDSILEQNRFKGTACIVKNNEVIYRKSFGKADKEGSTDNTVDTVYRIASNTKQFTAAAVMLLQEEGRLSVQDTIDAYFPDYPYAKNITIHELLCMRSGIKDYIAYTDRSGHHIALRESELEYSISADAEAGENISSAKDWIFRQELNFTPDEQFEYSNSNYLLLAEIIQQVSGMTYEDYLRTNIFEPLGMTASGFFDSYAVDGAVIAQPLQNDAGTEYMSYPGMSFGAGDILANAEDIAKWLDSFANGRLLTEESLKAMTANYSHEGDSMQYGYGLMIDEDGIYHEGYISSFNSVFYTAPDKQYSVILMSNNPSTSAEVLMKRINRELKDVLNN